MPESQDTCSDLHEPHNVHIIFLKYLFVEGSEVVLWKENFQ